LLYNAKDVQDVTFGWREEKGAVFFAWKPETADSSGVTPANHIPASHEVVFKNIDMECNFFCFNPSFYTIPVL
jgi:hypothetical protein